MSAFIIGLTGLLTPNYMSGEIEIAPYKTTIKGVLDLNEDFVVPDVLKMADFGLFR